MTSRTSKGSYKSRVDAPVPLASAPARRFPFFAPSATTPERVVRQRPAFAQTPFLRPRYTSVTTKKCVDDTFRDLRKRIRRVLIGGANFRPRGRPDDHPSVFGNIENPHPKMVKPSHYRPEVRQTGRQRANSEKSATTPNDH